MRTIQIQDNPEAHSLTVFFQVDGQTVKKAQFFNFFGNGDILGRAMGDFIKFGILPESAKGLISAD